MGVLAVVSGCASQGAQRGPATAAGADNTGSAGGGAQSTQEASDNLIQVAEEVVVNAPVEQIWPVFDDPNSYWKILPMVRAVKPRGNAKDGALLVELEQGISFASGSYTARVFKIRPYELELSIDHAYPSVLRDGRGTVEMKPEGEGKTRVTYRMTADIGDSWVLHLLKGRIQDALTRPPHLLKSHVEGGKRLPTGPPCDRTAPCRRPQRAPHSAASMLGREGCSCGARSTRSM